MAGQDNEIRAAQVALARALARPGARTDELDEAERLLERALEGITSVPLEEPAAWQVLSELAAIARQRGRTQREFDFLVQAVIAAPANAAIDLADRALGLLQAAKDPVALVDGLPPIVAQDLGEAARDPVRPDEVVRLAARLELVRGRVASASEMSQRRESVASDAGDLQAARTATSALQKLAEGDLDGANSELEGVRDLRNDPAVALAEALLLYARDDVEAARRRAESSTGTGELAAVAVIALLRQAALSAKETESLYKDARTIATNAARHDPSSGEALLLRAQVLMEAGWELDLGRELLGTAIVRVKKLDALPWWQIQERARTDGRYAYFRAEIAAAQGDREELIRWAESFGAAGTLYAQDARVRELWAAAVNDPAEATALLRAAAAGYRQANDFPAATRCLRQAFQIQPDSMHGLDLADSLWASSFGPADDSDAAEWADEGLRLLGSLEGQHPDSSLARASLLWGLLLARRDGLASGDQPLRSEQRWRALPHLLLASMLQPDAPYSWAHLAWACMDADLRWPAAHASRIAAEQLPGDYWLMETCLITELNWSGVLTDELRDWLRDVSSEQLAGWTAAVTALDLLVQGRAAAAIELLPQIDFDALWSREVRTQVLVLGRSLEAARDDINSLIQETTKRGQLIDAAWWALLVDPDGAQALADQAAVDGAANPGTQAVRAATELVISDGALGAEGLLAMLERTCRPSRLRAEIGQQLRLLAAAYEEQPRVLAALVSLSQRAEKLLQGLDLSPPLTVELETAEAWCDDAELAQLVRRLLERADGCLTSVDPLPAVPWLPGSATVAAGWDALSHR